MAAKSKRRRRRRDSDCEKKGHGRGQGGAQPFWSGTITFGLVSVPVDLFPSSRPSRLSLRMLSEDGVPLNRRYWCPHDEKEVAYENLVRGYELEEDKHVFVTDEELEELAPRKSRDIDLRRFVPVESIDPAFFERAYFLTPGGETTKPYRLLARVMEETGRAGIATFVMRGKEYLVAILAEGGILRAETMRFHDEVRTAEEVGLPEIEEAPRSLVSSLESAIRKLTADELDPGALEDARAARLEKLVKSKAERGKDVVVSPSMEEEADEDGEGRGIDLLEAIKRSMSGIQSGNGYAKGNGSALEDLTKDELYEKAAELDVSGRSGMTKAQLVKELLRYGA